MNDENKVEENNKVNTGNNVPNKKQQQLAKMKELEEKLKILQGEIKNSRKKIDKIYDEYKDKF